MTSLPPTLSLGSDISVPLPSQKSILLYGPSGCGKTSFCATIPDVIMVSFDPSGLIPIRGLPIPYIEFLDNDHRRPTAFRRYNEWWRSKEGGKALSSLPSPPPLCFDSATVLQDYILWEARYDDVMSTGKRSLDDPPAEHHWGSLIERFKMFLAEVTAYPGLTIVVFHEVNYITEVGSEALIYPSIYGKKLPNRAQRFFSDVWRMVPHPYKKRKTVDGKEYPEFWFRTRPTTRDTAKNSSVAMNLLIPPSWPDILTQMERTIS